MNSFDVTAVRALTFDVFGTVVDWRRSVSAGLTRFFATRSHAVDWNAFTLEWRGLYQPSMDAVRGGTRDFVILDVLHRESLVSLLDRHGIDGLSEGEIDELSDLWHRLDPWPDVLPALNRLAPRYRLATLSNGNLSLMQDLAAHADLPWHALLGAEPARCYKPGPDAYLTSSAILNLYPADCLMVAAHNDDLQAARALGFRTAYINRPDEYGSGQIKDRQASDAWDIVGDSFADLVAALEPPAA